MDLSKTFQEVITVTRWFHCRYLWIDALCIIQDSVEDWQRESVQMHHVYRNALFNIAATGAEDSSVGLFFDRDPLLVTAGVVSASWDGPLRRGSFHFYSGDDIWSHGVNAAPLSKRAWVVQERILSRRNLHFGAQSLFFECHELEATETLPGGLPSTVFDWRWANRFKNIHFSFKDETVRTTSRDANPLLRNWHKTVSAYMECDLTNPNDKVIAISGLAQEFQCKNHDTYLAGLWKSHFSEQLLWSVQLCRQKNGLPSMRPPTYRAPSWSWLSIDADLINPIELDPILIQILDAKIQLVDEDNPTGPIKNGTLTISGQLQSACLQIRPKPGLYKRAKYFLIDSGSDSDTEERKYLVYVSFDEAAIRPKDVFYFPVQFWHEETLNGLLLVPTKEGEMEFTRVGTFELKGAPECNNMLQKKDDRKRIFTVV
ncbi:MAG: hypothetical protein M1830_010753 [Pleopsidium flavum]|nr:MAG: hypothetical protein M1830_010753 [Pleopsidium flavum]